MREEDAALGVCCKWLYKVSNLHRPPLPLLLLAGSHQGAKGILNVWLVDCFAEGLDCLVGRDRHKPLAELWGYVRAERACQHVNAHVCELCSSCPFSLVYKLYHASVKLGA